MSAGRTKSIAQLRNEIMGLVQENQRLTIQINMAGISDERRHKAEVRLVKNQSKLVRLNNELDERRITG